MSRIKKVSELKPRAQPVIVQSELRHLRKRLELSYEDVGFSLPGEFSNRAYMEQIARDTKLWRETWILPALDQLIAWADGKRATCSLGEF